MVIRVISLGIFLFPNKYSHVMISLLYIMKHNITVPLLPWQLDTAYSPCIYLLSTINFDFRGYSHVMMLTINCKATSAFLWLCFHRPCYIYMRDHAWSTSNYVECFLWWTWVHVCIVVMNVSLPHVQLLIACIDHISMIMVVSCVIMSDFLVYFPSLLS